MSDLPEDFDSRVSEVVIEAPAEDQDVPCAYRTGRAGTGKSFQLMAEAKQNSRIILSASTGIAAVNLGTVTINSILKYFNTPSLRDIFLSGQLARIMHNLKADWLALDEASMLGGDALTLLYRGARDANRYSDVTRPLGLLLVGDFAQLPPVHEPFAFESVYWDHFARNTTRLTHVWRQTDRPFLEALDMVREGRGADAADALDALGVEWCSMRDAEFDGTTIVPVNQQVSSHNEVVLDRFQGKAFSVGTRRWGQQRAEWGENKHTHEWGIPLTSHYKIGSYVMLLSNSLPEFEYCNGDCGHIMDYDETAGYFTIRLVRTGKDVEVHRIVRSCDQAHRPEPWAGETIERDSDAPPWYPQPHYRERTHSYVLGQVEHFPLRLAYASSVHKSQGLTLDRVQADFRHWFFSAPSMMYVALSRCRTLGGLRLVGTKDKFVKQVKVDYKVRAYL